MGKLIAEHQRLLDYRNRVSNWKQWGPYLSERAWGTVREDFHGDNGAGLGASHQTGWTGLITRLIHQTQKPT